MDIRRKRANHNRGGIFKNRFFKAFDFFKSRNIDILDGAFPLNIDSSRKIPGRSGRLNILKKAIFYQSLFRGASDCQSGSSVSPSAGSYPIRRSKWSYSQNGVLPVWERTPFLFLGKFALFVPAAGTEAKNRALSHFDLTTDGKIQLP